jgi:hypothetical protein
VPSPENEIEAHFAFQAMFRLASRSPDRRADLASLHHVAGVGRMSPMNVRIKPLSVLAVFLHEDAGNLGLLSGLRKHFTLICHSVRQVLETASTFAPDVLLIDERVPESDSFADAFVEGEISHPTARIALKSADYQMPASKFDHQLAMPVSEFEMDKLLTQIGHKFETHRLLTRTSA